MWLDVVFTPLYVAGVETLDTPAGGSGYGTAVIHADYTHSLLGALLLSALFGALLGWRWGRKAGLVLAAVAFSHWVLDLIVHRADLPILPGNLAGLPLLGFGLWRAPVASMLLDAALLLAGVLLYWRAAKRSTSTTKARTSPALASLVLLASGIAVLALDAMGL